MLPMVLILDLAVLAVLALCAWRGAVKGLVLTLCSLVAVIVAFLGSTWISNQFSEPVSEFIQPYVSGYVENLLDDSLDQFTNSTTGTTPSLQIPSSGDEEFPAEIQATLNEVLTALQESKLFSGLIQSASDAVDAGSLAVTTSAVAAVAGYLSFQLARAGLFLLSFLLILVLWWLVSHMLDLAFKLPVLRTFNKAGGLLLGLVKGALVLLVACWAIRFFELVPLETTQQTWLFSFFMNFQLI